MGRVIPTTIVSGFPAIGKSYLAKHFPTAARDMESSEWHWVYEDGVKKANPDWPKNYIEQISALDKSGMYRVVCVSSHQLIRDEMAKAGIKYTNIVPADTDEMKNLIIQRCKDRGSPDTFIADLNAHYSEYVQSMINDPNAKHVMVLTKETIKQWDALALME